VLAGTTRPCPSTTIIRRSRTATPRAAGSATTHLKRVVRETSRILVSSNEGDREAEMSEHESDGPREDAPNPTQEQIDREGPSDQPVDVGGWEDNEPSAHSGEGGQTGDVA
jgi:hypothetical protein